MGLSRYQQKRDFDKTPEPKGRMHKGNQFRFYIQKHAASHLHYDFRLELDGVLKSWAVPKGPSFDPDVKRLAIHVEDHPIEYGKFEGIIPKGEYGGGTVMLWDIGTWDPLDKDPLKAYQEGHLRFELHAEKLRGRWDLFRFSQEEKSWFLKKYQDDYACKDLDIIIEEPNSALSGQTMDEITAAEQAIWTKKGLKKKCSLPKPPVGKAPMPTWISPQLTTLVDEPPEGNDWLHEVKWDGYRILAFKNQQEITLLSRNRKNWTENFSNIVEALQKLPLNRLILDGEIVLLDEKSRSDFQKLQNSFKNKQTAPFIYYVFDLLYYENWDIRSLTLLERKKILAKLLKYAPAALQLSNHIIGEGLEMFQKSCQFGLEGIISKRGDSPYLSKRNKNWLKIKCLQRQEFVIGGFTPPKNSRSHFGSLYLGLFDQEGNFIYCGNVGTGFTELSLKEIYQKISRNISPSNPFQSKPPGVKTATWVKPEIVAEIEFTEWTSDGHLRHPSFKGLREDKKASEIKKEIKQPLEDSSMISQIHLTHPEKILYKEDSISKKDLFDYYQFIAPTILPYLINRPLTIVRCPSQYKDCFYQKKWSKSATFLHPIEIVNNDGTEKAEYFYIDDADGLLSLVQMGVLEIHPWGSTIYSLECPDRITIDLDPAPELPWKAVVEAAFDVKKHLQAYELMSFVKTTGGKGLHVVIPIKAEYEWETVKQFTQIFVQFLEKKNPDKYIRTMSKAKRKGKIFIDYLRNQRGATAIGAYSTRARIHAPVSTPLFWEELSEHREDTEFTIFTLPKRMEQLKQDPWKELWTIQQSLNLDDL